MSDGTIAVLGLLAVTGMVGMVGVIYERLHPTPAPPFRWSDADHQHALIMSRYYRKFGPGE